MRIKRAIFEANQEKPGYAKLVRYATYEEIANDLFNVLKNTQSPTDPEASILDMAEYYNVDMLMEKSSEFKEPVSDHIVLKVLCTHGNNEGMRVDLMAFDTSGKDLVSKYIAGVKFLCDEDNAWMAARVADQALHDGLDVIID